MGERQISKEEKERKLSEIRNLPLLLRLSIRGHLATCEQQPCHHCPLRKGSYCLWYNLPLEEGCYLDGTLVIDWREQNE